MYRKSTGLQKPQSSMKRTRPIAASQTVNIGQLVGDSKIDRRITDKRTILGYPRTRVGYIIDRIYGKMCARRRAPRGQTDANKQRRLELLRRYRGRRTVDFLSNIVTGWTSRRYDSKIQSARPDSIIASRVSFALT